MALVSRDLPALDGVRVGHWTDTAARTGCTVIRFDAPALTAVDVRGAAPGTRELALLQPGMAVQRPDAILLTGGSAFGLAAADGVMRWLRERGRGYPTPAGPVPIVPAAVLYDLATGDPVWPDAHAGHAATDAAEPMDRLETGRVGAGTGATAGQIAGASVDGGLFAAACVTPHGTAVAIVALNPFGVLQESAKAEDPRAATIARSAAPPLGQATTLLACVTDIPLSHDALIRMTVAMHDGLARAIVPVHTIADGDIAFASTVREDPACPPGRGLAAALAAELAVEHAIARLASGT